MHFISENLSVCLPLNRDGNLEVQRRQNSNTDAAHVFITRRQISEHEDSTQESPEVTLSFFCSLFPCYVPGFLIMLIKLENKFHGLTLESNPFIMLFLLQKLRNPPNSAVLAQHQTSNINVVSIQLVNTVAKESAACLRIQSIAVCQE